jgi:heat shock protein HslJ
MRHVGLLTLIALLAGCALGTPVGLDGRTFVSSAVTDGGAERPLVPGTEVALRFENGRVSADAGCNTMGGAYRVANGRLLVDEMAMTALGCDAPRHEQDDWLADFLGSGPMFALSAHDLALTDGDTAISFVDRAAARPDRPIVGPVWTVESLLQADIASSVPAGTTATLQFAADGTVAIDAGCNTGQARMTADGTRVTFSDIGVTRRACAGPEAQLEAAVLSVLGAPQVELSVEDGVMTINTGQRAIVLVAR